MAEDVDLDDEPLSPPTPSCRVVAAPPVGESARPSEASARHMSSATPEKSSAAQIDGVPYWPSSHDATARSTPRASAT